MMSATKNMKYMGRGDYAGSVLGTATVTGDYYTATRWVAGGTGVIERKGGLSESDAKYFLRSDSRPGRIVRK